MQHIPTLDAPQRPLQLKQILAALNDTLLRISSQNTDYALAPLISEAMSHCNHLHQLLQGTALSPKEAPPAIIDAKVFQRLMVLAGPTTIHELLDQLFLDLRNAQTAIAKAAPALDWPILRKECHVLIAIAGSIGAYQVMTSAETLHRTVQRADASTAPTEAAVLLHMLEALIAFVQDKRSSKAAP